MRSLIQTTPAYQLSVDVRLTAYGHHVRFISMVPTARRPGEQVQFQALLSTQELQDLHRAIGAALKAP